MFCRKCGKEISDQMSFCTACGTPVLANADNEVKKEDSTHQTVIPVPSKPERKEGKGILIALCVVGFIVGILLFVLIFSLQNKSEDADENKVLLSELAEGDSYILGKYEQDGDKRNGAEPIEWIILIKDGEDALLISKKILDTKAYGDSEDIVTWEESSVRKWLNEDFYDTAFSESEKSHIMLTQHNNPDSYDFYDSDYTKIHFGLDWAGTGMGGNGGENTEDKVFLLSWQEALEYFEDEEKREAQGSDYANKTLYHIEEGNYKEEGFGEEIIGNGLWWLRSPGAAGTEALSVYYDGRIHSQTTNSSFEGIRPVIWITDRQEETE